ncbi:MAG: hypothetical protein U1E23_17155 [Reyranellaceae bacterium]
MTRTHLFAVASLLAAAAWGGALAQQAQPQGQRPAGVPAATAPNGQPYAEPGPLSGPMDGPPSPVIMVTSVEVLRSPRSGGMDIIRARGLTTSTSWTNPHLIPITRGQPIDGVLDVLFEANAPNGAVEIGPFMPIEALLPVENGHPYKGIRVRAATNVVSLKELPGYAEVAGPKNDCSTCLGKYFVAKGANPPANVAADNLVREADLPWTLRVIRPTDGIPSYAPDPNRLTLVLSEDGRIVDAGWD